MKINELLTVDNGIFQTVFQTEFPDEFTNIFGTTSAKSLDIQVVKMYGNRTLLACVTPDNYKEFVRAIIEMNVDNWVKCANAMNAEYNVLNPVIRETNRTETRETDETNNSENVESEKVYNDTEFNENNKSNESGTANKTETVTYKNTESGIGSNKNISETIQKEMTLRAINWKNSIIFALIKEIIIDLYE